MHKGRALQTPAVILALLLGFWAPAMAGTGCFSGFDPECADQLVDGCDVRQNTSFPPGEHVLPFGLDICGGVTLDCQGATLVGDGSWNGIRLEGVEGATVRNCVVKNYTEGILLLYDAYGNQIEGNILLSNSEGVSGRDAHGNNILSNAFVGNGRGISFGRQFSLASLGNVIEGNSIEDNLQEGIWLDGSADFQVASNLIRRNGNGLHLGEDSGGHAIDDNRISENAEYGILIDAPFSGGFAGFLPNNITNNAIEENRVWDFWVDCFGLVEHRLENNTGSGGRPIGVFMNQSARLEDAAYSELILCNADGSVLTNVEVSGSPTLQNNGMDIVDMDDSVLNNITSSNNNFGLGMSGRNTTILNVETNGNARGGLGISGSRLALGGIAASDNGGDGIFVPGAADMNLTNITAVGNNWSGVFVGFIPGSNANITLAGSRILNNSRSGVVVIGASAVNLTANRIQDNGGAGVLLWPGGPVSIEHSNVSGSGDDGISVNQSGPLNVTGSRIYGNGKNGIAALDSPDLFLRGTDLVNNTYHGANLTNSPRSRWLAINMSDNHMAGLFLNLSPDCVIADGEAGFNNHSGIALLYTNQCNLTNNTVHHNAHNTGGTNGNLWLQKAGIYLERSNFTRILNNSVFRNRAADRAVMGGVIGIDLELASSFSEVANNTIWLNGDDGIGFAPFGLNDQNNISSNAVFNNTDEGIHLYCGSNNSIWNNTVRLNNMTGIALNSRTATGGCGCPATHNRVFNNSLLGNGLDTQAPFHEGILLGCAHDNAVFNNSIRLSTRDGLHVIAATGNNLSGNAIWQNERHGIFLDQSLGTLIQENAINASNQSGLALYFSDGTRAENNTLMRNNATGLLLEGAYDNNISRNRILFNRLGGLNLSASGDNAVLHNNVTDNLPFGIRLEASSGNNLSGNLVCFNNRSDVNATAPGNAGQDNQCDAATGWNDTNRTGCTYTCVPALFIHGIYSADAMWDDWRPRFEESGIRTFGIGELRGSLGYFPTNGKIEDSAWKLAMALLRLKARDPNVREVDIVAHSQGGLVARSYLVRYAPYVITEPPIRRLITLGTPHLGSPICNVPAFSVAMGAAQGSLLDLFAAENQNQVDDKSCGGGQMIPGSPFLSELARKSQNNPSVARADKFGVVGTGDHAHAALQFIDRTASIPGLVGKVPVLGGLLKWLGHQVRGVPYAGKLAATPIDLLTHESWTIGEDDGVVPAASQAYPDGSAESFSLNVTHSTAIEDNNTEYHNFTILGFVLDVLKNGTSGRLPQFPAAPPGEGATADHRDLASLPQPEPVHLQQSNLEFHIDSGALGAGQSRLTLVPFDPARDRVATKIFLLMFEGGNATVTLTTPSGRLITPSMPAPNLSMIALPEFGLRLIAVSGAEGGNWTANVTAHNGTQVNYTLSAYSETDVTFTFGAANSTVSPEGDLLLTGRLTHNDSALAGGNITVMILKPDNSTHNFSLLDDGAHGDGMVNDGLFAETLSNVTLDGQYALAAVSQFLVQGALLERYGVLSVWAHSDADMRLTNLSASPAAPLAGQSVALTAVAENLGLRAASAVIELYDGAPLEEALIGSAAVTLPPNASLESAIPWMATEGAHEILAILKPATQDDEYSDNQISRLLVVAPSGNAPPVLEPIGPRTIFEGQTLLLDVNATDPENDTLVFGTNADTVLRSLFFFNTTSGLFSWTPLFNDSGVYTVAFNVTDWQGSDSESVQITVRDARPRRGSGSALFRKVFDITGP